VGGRGGRVMVESILCVCKKETPLFIESITVCRSRVLLHMKPEVLNYTEKVFASLFGSSSLPEIYF
jgi:hypothetical protein